jgi:hypothetical protein
MSTSTDQLIAIEQEFEARIVLSKVLDTTEEFVRSGIVAIRLIVLHTTSTRRLYEAIMSM